MNYFTELDPRRQGDMNGSLLLSAKNPLTGH
jgi:hypothetical protein